MNKLKSFLMTFILLAIVAVAVFLAGLIYRANERMSVRTYIFQMDDNAKQRVGNLQDIHDISAEELLEKLIHKYVSEYFKVIPDDTDVLNRPILANLSSANAFKIWSETEAKTITKMSEQKMFRIVEFPKNSIEPLNKPSNYDYNDVITKPVYYAVRYNKITWAESNKMNVTPAPEHGILDIEAKFQPGIREYIEEKQFDIKKYLKDGKNPVGLFRFEVTNIGNKGL